MLKHTILGLSRTACAWKNTWTAVCRAVSVDEGQIFAPTQKFATITKDRQRAKYINEADFDGKIYCIW